MKKLYSFLVFAFLLTTFNINLNAQNTQNPIWSMPPNYYSFPGGAFIPLPKGSPGAYFYYNGQSADYSSNMIADPNGNILFFIIDGVIYNKRGNVSGWLGNLGIKNNQAVSTDLKGNAETVIVPDPGNCRQFYIFTTENYKYLNFHNAYYGVYNLDSMNTGRESPYNLSGLLNPLPGCLLPSKSNLNKYTTDLSNLIPNFTGSWSEKSSMYFAATKLRSDKSRLIFIYDGISDMYVLRLDAINGLTYSTHFSISQSSGNSADSRAELEVKELTNGNYRIACVGQGAMGNNYFRKIFAFETDNNGNFKTNSLENFSFNKTPSLDPAIHGLEFSPNGRYIYFTQDYATDIQYIDYQSSSIGSISGNNTSSFQSSQIELGNDGKLYLANGTSLGNIDNPNNPASLATWNSNYKNISYAASSARYNPANNKDLTTYTLPDQIDGMNYDTISNNENISCCIDYATYDPDNNTVTSTDTWDGINNLIHNGYSTVYIKEELRITAGTELTLKNMVFHFAPGAKVVVERGNSNETGGRLNLDNTTFTSDNRCDANGMWLGVQVRGYRNKYQTHSIWQQGIITVKNNSVIENAYKGVAAVKFDIIGTDIFNPNYDYNYTGGFVLADNSSFINNLTDVELLYYYDKSISHFKNCDFTTNDNFKEASISSNIIHVKLFDVIGVRFMGCDFENNSNYLHNYVEQGIGIKAANAKFSVSSRCIGSPFPCTNIDRSKFSKLHFGIYATYSNSSRSIYVNKTDFNNNQFGIDLLGNQKPVITENNFTIPSNVIGPGIGLALSGCNNYKIEENSFIGQQMGNAPLFGAKLTGILVDNSGPDNNRIYKNFFEFLKIGGQSQRVNANNYSSTNHSIITGLLWKCNTFSLQAISKADLAVTSGRIRYLQGYFSNINPSRSLAGNKFSHGGLTDNDIAVNLPVSKFEYNCQKDAVTTPQYYDPTRVKVNIGQVYLNNNSCLSSISVGGGIGGAAGGVVINPDLGIEGGGIIVAQSYLSLQADSLRGNIAAQKNKIDHGWTNAWLNYIATNVPGLKDTLLAYSPYLSDTVLTSYLNIQPPDNDIQAVILANSPVSDVVMNQLTTMTDISSEVMDNIEDAQTGELSARDSLYQDIAYVKGILDYTVNIRLSLYLTDTSGIEEDSVIAILERRGTETAKKQLCNFYIDIGDYPTAYNVWTQIENEYGHDSYIDLVDVAFQLEMNMKGLYDLKDDSALLNQVEAIAYDDDDFYSVSAKAMLSVALDTIFIPIVEPLYSSPPLRKAKDEKENKQETYSQLVIYPNPSGENDEVVIELQSNDPEVSMSSPSIEIYDLTGKLCSTYQLSGKEKRITIPTNKLHSGVYFVKLNENGHLVGVKKMVIQ